MKIVQIRLFSIALDQNRKSSNLTNISTFSLTYHRSKYIQRKHSSYTGQQPGQPITKDL